MIWGVLEITVHLSSGMILRKVTVFIIDTPSGLFPEDVARVKNTAKYLQPGPVGTTNLMYMLLGWNGPTVLVQRPGRYTTVTYLSIASYRFTYN